MNKEKELKEFEAWFKDCAWRIIPKEEDVPPKYYKKYKQIAFAAWQETECRKRMDIAVIIEKVKKGKHVLVATDYDGHTMWKCAVCNHVQEYPA